MNWCSYYHEHEIGKGEKQMQKITDEQLYRKIGKTGKEIISKEFILKNVRHEVVNKARNRELLNGLVYTELADIAAIYSVTLKDNAERRLSYKVPYGLLEHIELTEEELEQAAKKNTMGGLDILPLTDVLNDILGFDTGIDGIELYVATSIDKYKGAAAILYPEFMKICAEEIGGAFYIIPSSIHELILLRKQSEIVPEELVKTLKEVNATELMEDEILSDHVYLYDPAEGMVRMIA